MKKMIAVILSLFMICTFSACSSEKNNEEILITSQNSPDGNYSVCLYQVGSPQWSFGSVGAKLVLKKSNGEIVDEKNLTLRNSIVGPDINESGIGLLNWFMKNTEHLLWVDV